MVKNKINSLSSKVVLSAAIAMAISVSASADDIDVYTAAVAGQNNPNVLFVLDYSASMLNDVNDNPIPDGDTTTQSKFEILTEAVDDLLAANVGKVNVGLGSLYRWRSSGVKWPISDLAEDPNTVDPDIPAGTVTTTEVISAQMQRMSPDDSTATVNALAEAAAYFRGDPVLHHDRNVNVPWDHQPDTWDTATMRYEGGNSWAALPASYLPRDAYNPNETDIANSGIGWCTNYTNGSNHCEGLDTFNCEFRAGGTGTSTSNNDGVITTGTWTSSDRTVCEYHTGTSWTTPNYESPLTQACQANFIVLISDGQPTVATETTTMTTVLNAAGVPGSQMHNCEDLGATIFSTTDLTDREGDCGPEILDYLASNDINPAIEDSNVKTYTVGFSLEGAGKEYLRLLAEKGQGEFHEATQPAELTQALNDVIDSILSGSQNFAELSIDVDRDSLSHENRTYFSLFSPSSKSSWQGNLKGYFINSSGLIDINGDPATVIEEGKVKFAETTQSFWSSIADGNEVMQGGASESITDLPDAPNTRNMYTNLGGNALSLGLANRIEKDNTLITDAVLGNPAAGVRDAALDWLANAPMGDPLHTKPVTVNYPTKKVVYTMTNQGFLHAFDATNPTTPGGNPVDVSGGEELFAFMPAELLKNIPDLYEPVSGAPHIYGLDGSITRLHDDGNNNGVVDGLETVTLIVGMRRGGKSYYAIDVTDPLNPSLKWDRSKYSPDFGKLEQSWSRASLVTVNDDDASRKVLFFGGGFDANTVDGTTTPTAAGGNAIFAVSTDGTYLWSLDENTHPDLKYSVPSDLTVIDSDADGWADRIYFGDLGGQIWRVDFDDITEKNNVTLTKLADLKDPNVLPSDHQPVFYAPSVSLVKEQGERFFAISFGTGDRTQPLLETAPKNAFYMLKDTNTEVGPPPSDFQTITFNDIYDASNNDVGSVNTTVAEAAKDAMSQASGWLVFLNQGEKALSKVVTFEGKFLATTFEPAPDTSTNLNACEVNTLSSLYIMNVADARPIEILADGSESYTSLTAANRKKPLQSAGIPSTPKIVFLADSDKIQIMVGKEAADLVNGKIRTVFWHAK